MAKIVVRKESGKLLFDFTHKGVRCREQSLLEDTPANRRRLNPVLAKLKEALGAGTFNYGDFFPGSPMASRFAVGAADVATGSAADGNQSPVPVATATTPALSTFAEQWFTEHKVEWRRSHIAVLRSTLDGHVIKYFAAKPVGSISKADILAFRNHLASMPGKGEKSVLSNKRINGILQPLRQIMEEAADRFGFPSPMQNYKPLRIRKTDVNPFTLDQVQAILSKARPDFHDYFLIRFFTGMRTGEAHGLKWKYVDFANRLILIRETFVLGEDEYTKTDGSQREIQMSQPVVDALQRMHAATFKLSEYVFCNREGKPLDNKNFTDRIWYPLLRNLGLELRRPYQMRHTAATLWLASGEAPEWIARQLGHSSTEMLFRVYSRYVPNLTRQDGSAIERLLASRFATGGVASEPAAPSNSAPPKTSPGSAGLVPSTKSPGVQLNR